MYYGIEKTERYPHRFLCEQCADSEALHTLHIIQRLDKLPEPDRADSGNPIAIWCNFCNAPLDTYYNEDRRIVNVLEMVSPYRSAPITRFQPATLARLNEIAGEINDPATSATATTEGARSALELDQQDIARALALQMQGYTIFVAQDEEGWYFAALQSHSGFDEKTQQLLVEKPSIHPEKAGGAA